jgi:hypothetical protein
MLRQAHWELGLRAPGGPSAALSLRLFAEASTAWHGMARHGTARHGMAWHGIASHRIASHRIA